ncbi:MULTISPECIES: hypothetical protein [Salipiger]|jgi:hypothetical protein|uniref:Uncharacterized protein n=1 Tax=Salipiger profundus TaxID=1229727 RepID=A0A1U7D104_9RHOB|nr:MULTISPECIES: hypothetical protein [Salipiger]APX21765.1 hypothetical protein Ga0080559_TMP969 [Salipiger profundus]GGA00042.1 hypothetical protein GCM10011326_08890 [Salipiger profundus]SFC07909.1 hypothetical protein SAMN05444415_10244 [Salipiger profundus]|tara:strand:- start:447 stop:620 length:174 start_codon:yes stop_codon:yes gene_type:complete
MKYALPLVVLAGPLAAHTGESAHVHPHDGASWLVTVAVLGVAALAGHLIVSRVRNRK